MTIEELINEYKQMTYVCSLIDYADMETVEWNNQAVSRMYEIIELIRNRKEKDEILEFSNLLDIKENRTDIWVAVQILELLEVDNDTEEKALRIIKKDAETSTGMKYWLEDYSRKKDL